MKEYKYGQSKIVQLPSGSWRLRLWLGTVNGKQQRVSITGATPKEVIRKAEDCEKQNRKASVLTLTKAMQEYVNTCKLAGHSPSTIANYQKIIRIGIELIGGMPVNQIKVTDIQSQINLRARHLAAKTVANEYGLIHKVLTVYAPDLNLSGIVLPTKRNKVNADAGIVIPEDNQLTALLQAAEKKDT